MGFPSENLEGIYRNHMDDVRSFLEEKHMVSFQKYRKHRRGLDVPVLSSQRLRIEMIDRPRSKFLRRHLFCRDARL